MISTITRLLMVSRPISWVNTAYPFAAGYIMTGGNNLTLLIVGSIFFLLPYNLLMYGINDVFDYESDIKNPRKGGIEGMREQRAFHPTIVKASILTTLPFVVWLGLVGSLLNLFVLLGLIFFVIAYSVKGLRFKEVPFLDSVTSSIHFVGPLIYALTFTGFSATTWIIIAAFFLWGMASHALGAIQDILPDRQGGISSIATVLGARTTTWIVIGLYTAAAIILLLLPRFGWLMSIVTALYVANCMDIRTITDTSSAKANKPWKRFIWLNQVAGFVVTIALIVTALS